jgi:hypothetical protein
MEPDPGMCFAALGAAVVMRRLSCPGGIYMSLGLILIIILIIALLGGFRAFSAAMATAWATREWGSAD